MNKFNIKTPIFIMFVDKIEFNDNPLHLHMCILNNHRLIHNMFYIYIAIFEHFVNNCSFLYIFDSYAILSSTKYYDSFIFLSFKRRSAISPTMIYNDDNNGIPSRIPRIPNKLLPTTTATIIQKPEIPIDDPTTLG